MAECRESVVVLDWKDRELVQMAAAGVAEATGSPARIFAPFEADNRERYNPMQPVIDAAARGEPIVDDARTRLRVLFYPKLAIAAQNAWITELAQLWAQLVIVARAHKDPEAATLGGLWDFAHSSYLDVQAFMEVASEHTDIEGGFVAAMANGWLNQFTDPDQNEFKWAMQSLAECVALFAPGSYVRQATDSTTLDVASLKQHPQALFITIPDRYLMTAGPAVAAILDAIVETCAYAKGPHRVAILAEEFGALAFNENVLKWVRTYRSLGIRFICVVQDRSGFSKYQKHGAHKPFEQNSAKLLFGISDPAHLRELEQRAGKRAVLIGTASTSLGLKVPGRNLGVSETLRPVLAASEIARIGPGKALLDIPGQPLFILDRPPWWEQPDIAPYMRDARFDQT